MSFEWFPKGSDENPVSTAYFLLIVLGTFGAHQFYFRNMRKGFFLLATGGISHLILIYIMNSDIKFEILNRVDLLAPMLIGYVLCLPVLIWDIFTLRSQFNMINRSSSS